MTDETAAQAPLGMPQATQPYTHLKSYHKSTILLGQIAGILQAVIAGVGVGTGMLDPESGILSGYVVPILMGFALAFSMAIGWHILQVNAARVRRPMGYVIVVGGGGALVALAILTSSWAIATALSGYTSVDRYMRGYLGDAQTTFNTVVNNANNEVTMQGTVKAAADQLRATVKSEELGMLSGRQGHGPISRLLEGAATRFDELAASMDKPIAGMQKQSGDGRELIQEMPGLIRSDHEKFEKDAVKLQALASQLSVFRLTDRAKDVEATNAAFGIDNAKPIINSVVATVLRRAAELDDARKPVAIPNYTPITPREATKLYAGSAALGGWLTGIGVDAIPFLFVLITLCTAKETLMHRIKPARPPRMGDNEHEADPDGVPPGSSPGRPSILGSDEDLDRTNPNSQPQDDGEDERVMPFRITNPYER